MAILLEGKLFPPVHSIDCTPDNVLLCRKGILSSFLWKVLEQLNRLISMVSDVVGKSWLFEIVGISSIAGVGEMDRVDMMLWGICTLQAKHEDLSSDPEVVV